MKNTEIRNNFLQSENIDCKKLILANQIHSNIVKSVSSADAGKVIDNCDGLITTEKDLYLGIFTADCMPILMVSKNEKVKAAIHAGWRGLALGIIESAVEAFVQNHISPYEIRVYIAPHIRDCCYEVNPTFENIFDTRLNENKLDMSAIAKSKMHKCGIRQIYISKFCTKHKDDLFFSYRKDKCNDRLLSIV
jgi:YfiH family protein